MDELEFRVIEVTSGSKTRFQLQVLFDGGVIEQLATWLTDINLIALKQCLEEWVKENA